MVGRRLFISAAESSGDMHAAGLIGAMRQDRGDLSVEGLGGGHLRGVGCDLLEESTAKSAMLMGSITRAAFFWRLSHRLRAHWRRHRPELVILVDSPAVNLHFAKLAKAQGIEGEHVHDPSELDAALRRGRAVHSERTTEGGVWQPELHATHPLSTFLEFPRKGDSCLLKFWKQNGSASNLARR